MSCPACEFEVKYGTVENPRPVPDLKIHTCGQLKCPQCAGFSVINGARMGAFAVIGGDPCPLCSATGRVSPEVDRTYVRMCRGWLPDANGTHVRCKLPASHLKEGKKCQP